MQGRDSARAATVSAAAAPFSTEACQTLSQIHGLGRAWFDGLIDSDTCVLGKYLDEAHRTASCHKGSTVAKTKGQPQAFSFAKDDPLARQHEDVAKWVEEAFSSVGKHQWYQEVDLKSLPSGKTLLDAKGELARSYVSAALAQTRHWDQMAEQVRDQAENEMQRINAHHLPGWAGVWGRRRQAEAVVRALMRRKLPLTRQDLLELLSWCNQADNLSPYHFPLTYIVRALERFTEGQSVDEELREAMQQFAARLRACHDNKASRLGTNVEQICAVDDDVSEEDDEFLPPPKPAPVGQPCVLVALKQRFGISSDATLQTNAETIGPDQFPLTENSPLQNEHALLTQLLEEVIGTTGYHRPELSNYTAGRELLHREPDAAGQALLAATERHVHALLAPSTDYSDHGLWQARYAVAGIAVPLSKTRFRLSREGRFDLLLYLAVRPAHEQVEVESLISELIDLVQRDAEDSDLTEGERFVLSLFRASLVSGPLLGNSPPNVSRLTSLIGDGARFCLEPGEVWADAVNQDFTAMTTSERRAWSALFSHLLTATSARPSKKWLKTGDELVGSIGSDKLHKSLAHWLPLVARGRSIGRLGSYSGDARGAADTMEEENATCLRGILWLIPTLARANDLIRQVTAVAISAYKKVPGVGPRAVKVGNAAVYALSQLGAEEAVGQLAMLKVRVKFGTAQKEIEKAFNVAAEALGLPRDEIEEMGVPSYGLEESGRHEESLGTYRAEIVVTGTDAQLKWFDANGKGLKSVPAKVRKEHKDELKELKQSLKDIQGMLPAQRDRIDSMFLLQNSWPVERWRERYLDHPLVGTIARRLLWCVDGTVALFINGEPTDVDGNPITHGKTAEITLWHPVGCTVAEITAWRERLESLQLTQPFKQAHREIYLLTDAERNTRTYSNRYAAHIIRQHQFNALCAARGWKNRLRLMVDDSYPPASKELPNWGLRAEFWVEGIGDDYGGDTNESGVFLRLATDQVRFYRTSAATNYAHAGGGGYAVGAAGPGRDSVNEPLPLDQVPTLVFSEVMRDVDLFVGVASVGNDPTWQDGGPEGRFLDYWQSYSFGELSGSASTRKQVLERLVPRLKIAEQCSLSDRFLVVQGKKRTYKIHLGSGNILMEPNDQYLCIVPDSRSRSKQDDLFLPFEGDTTLSIIISKALLLAEDTKIKDPTINRQIDNA